MRIVVKVAVVVHHRNHWPTLHRCLFCLFTSVCTVAWPLVTATTPTYFLCHLRNALPFCFLLCDSCIFDRFIYYYYLIQLLQLNLSKLTLSRCCNSLSFILPLLLHRLTTTTTIIITGF